MDMLEWSVEGQDIFVDQSACLRSEFVEESARHLGGDREWAGVIDSLSVLSLVCSGRYLARKGREVGGWPGGCGESSQIWYAIEFSVAVSEEVECCGSVLSVRELWVVG